MKIHSRDDLLRRLNYDPDTGIFRWAYDFARFKKGDRAGTISCKGYVVIYIGGKNYLAHRLAWLFVHGRWPVEQIDHRNGIQVDNRIANLREATNAENQQNRAMRKSNSSGHQGVYWHKASRRWVARIWINCKAVSLGYFVDLDKAVTARRNAKAKLHTFQPVPRVLSGEHSAFD